MGGGEVSARVAVPLLVKLKLTLIGRYWKRSPLGAIGSAIALTMFSLLMLGGAVFLYFYCHEKGPAVRDSAFLWTAWVFALLWVTAPLSQFDTQRNLDLSALRLAPLSGATFTRAVLMDAFISPQFLMFLLPLLVCIFAFSLSPAELPIIALSFAVLLLSNAAVGQTVFLSISRLLSSRRFADISVILGVLFIFFFQGLNLLLHAGARMSVPPALRAFFDGAGALLAPALHWLYPGAAAGAVSASAAGNLPLAALKAGALLAQAGVAVWLVSRATRAFYEGEMEDGGRAKVSGPPSRRPAGEATFAPKVLSGPAGAIYDKERTYLWRDPLLKSLLLQSLMGLMLASFWGVTLSMESGSHQLAIPPRWLLLLLALALSFAESSLLFNKFGLEGPMLTSTLLSPVSRATILRAKSTFFLSHFLTLNIVLIAGLGIALKVPHLELLLPLLMLAANTCIVDVAGCFVSVWFPFTYRKRGRMFRPLYAQSGCGYLFLYGLAFQACNLAVVPCSAALVLGTLYYGWAGLAAGTLFSAVVVWAAYHFGIPLAARLLESREPELIAAVMKEPG